MTSGADVKYHIAPDGKMLSVAVVESSGIRPGGGGDAYRRFRGIRPARRASSSSGPVPWRLPGVERTT